MIAQHLKTVKTISLCLALIKNEPRGYTQQLENDWQSCDLFKKKTKQEQLASFYFSKNKNQFLTKLKKYFQV